MNKEELYLIYVNVLGEDWKGELIYQFLFTDSSVELKDVDGEQWDEFPASGKPEPPYVKFIYVVGKLSSDLRLHTIQHSDTFCVWDAVDGVVALAWENVDDYLEYPKTRIFFKYGETLQSVEDKLYEKDIILKLKTVTEHERIKE